MKTIVVNISRIVFACLLSFQNFGQKTIVLKRTISVKHFLIDYIPTGKCDYDIILPVTIPGKQEVLKYNFSINPSEYSKIEGNEKFSKWKNIPFSELDTVDLSATITLKLNNYDLKTARKHAVNQS